ncbi:MAG: cation:proton antiporter [Bdellovibrionales bacterium]|nr:cation:proton antiporter [Bdellovibrionales bacterium]
MHLPDLIRDLAIILALGGLVSFLFHRIKQPVVVGYIIAGLLVGPYTSGQKFQVPMPLVRDLPNIRIWAELGVVFLMFSLGLEFSFRKLMKVGAAPVLTALFEVGALLFTGTLFGLHILGWNLQASIFLGAVVSISSTTIIYKALEDLRLKTRRFAESIFAILIVEDLIAILLLVAMGSMGETFSSLSLLGTAGKMILVIGIWFLAGYFLVPPFIRLIGRTGSEEMLIVVSIALCLGLVVIAASLGFSTALGAFIMGSILAESTESYRIEERLQALRDLFSAVFFVSVGLLIDPRDIWTHLPMILSVSTLVVVGKITFVTLGSIATGQTLRSSIQVGFGMAQIGEFSFMMAGLGITTHATHSDLYPVAICVSLITTFLTPYLIRNSHKAAVWIEDRVPARMKDLLARYAAWSMNRKATVQDRTHFSKNLIKWSLNGFIVTAIFILVHEFVQPKAFKLLPELRKLQTQSLSWAVAMIAASPFWIKMFGLSKQIRSFEALTFRLGTLALMVGVSHQFFSIRSLLIGSLGAVVVVSVVFYRQLNATYHWVEAQFLKTFEPNVKSRRRQDVLRDLAPWDAHLVRMKVHPNSELVKMKMGETGLRSKHGLNVVAIQRGLQTLVAPKSDEMVLPKDELLVLGTDEQIEKVRAVIERPPGLRERFRDLSSYELRQVRVPKSSPLIEKSIRDAGKSELLGTLLVGVERNGKRVINPDSAFVIAEKDILWLVGEKEKLDSWEVQEEARHAEPADGPSGNS